MKNKNLYPDFWIEKNNKKIACKEKIKVLNENIYELKELINQIYDEAILMGVKKEQIREIINDIAKTIDTDLNA